MVLTEKQFLVIEQRVDEFNERTCGIHGIDYGDVIYSYFKSSNNRFLILNDWDEGKPNDPYWNDETNEHSAIHLIRTLIEELKSMNNE